MGTSAPTQPIRLLVPNKARLYDHIRSNARFATLMVGPDTHKGKTVNICGAGPSLANAEFKPAAETWGCNSALGYLTDRGLPVTHGFVIDPTEEMLGDREWGQAFEVGYYVASCVNPKLVAHLLAQGRNLQWFHSFLGMPDPKGWDAKKRGRSYEMALYTDPKLYKSGVQVGKGLNSVQRAICLALFMGFKKIRVYGADCACKPDAPLMPPYSSFLYPIWLDRLTAYADGTSALAGYGPQVKMVEGVIDGRRWHTRADMVISARETLDIMRDCPGRIELMGDTFPNALKDKDAEFWSNMPSLTDVGVVSGFGVAHAEAVQDGA